MKNESQDRRSWLEGLPVRNPAWPPPDVGFCSMLMSSGWGSPFSSSPSSSPSKGIASSGPCKSITIQFVTVVQSLCVCVCIKVTQLCPTLCSPMDYTLHGILQARILQWIFPTQGSNPVLPLQVDSLPAESH